MGPVAATKSIDPDRASVKCVSVPPESSVTHRGK